MNTRIAFVSLVVLVAAGVAGLVAFSRADTVSYSDVFENLANSGGAATTTLDQASSTPVFQVYHIPTPDPVKAVYFTSWAAGTKKFRTHMFDLVDTTEINAVVIDIKDYTGRISFKVDDPELAAYGSVEDRIPDIKELIGKLHDKGVYVIGRISSFQDSFLIKSHPEWAVKTKEGAVWQDYKGVKWLDAGAKPVWDYLAAIGKQAYADGFDELNFDYVRFPSDGNLKDVYYSWQNGQTREQILANFYAYLHETFSPLGIPISADFFGLTTSAADDLGIGQVLGDALKNFDYVAPMVYPSHFAHGFLGYEKPAQHPYEVIKYSMSHAITKADEASTTPDKLRPWFQAFDLGAIYTPQLVRDQMKASYELGLRSWMLWDAANVYDKNDLLPKEVSANR